MKAATFDQTLEGSNQAVEQMGENSGPLELVKNSYQNVKNFAGDFTGLDGSYQELKEKHNEYAPIVDRFTELTRNKDVGVKEIKEELSRYELPDNYHIDPELIEKYNVEQGFIGRTWNDIKDKGKGYADLAGKIGFPLIGANIGYHSRDLVEKISPWGKSMGDKWADFYPDVLGGDFMNGIVESMGDGFQLGFNPGKSILQIGTENILPIVGGAALGLAAYDLGKFGINKTRDVYNNRIRQNEFAQDILESLETSPAQAGSR